MSKRGDCIHKRKDGRWEGRHPQGRNENGTIKYASVYGKSYREAREKLKLFSSNFSGQQNIVKHKKSFGEVLDLWMENNRLRLKGGTINKYQSIIDSHIKPGLGFIRVVDIDSSKINNFLNEMILSGKLNGSGGLSASYVRSMGIVINSAMKYAVSEGLCSPLNTPISKPVAEQKEISILDEDSQHRLEMYLLDNLDLTNAGILISLHTGLRVGEICALSWNDIDLNKRVIHIRHTVARVPVLGNSSEQKTQLVIDSPKTKSSARDIPISSALYPIITEIQKLSNSNFVISQTNTFVHPRAYEYRYHKVLKKCNIAQIRYHALRHTFATRCIEAGVDVKTLSEILGHGSISVTLNTYVHSSMDTKRKQLEKLCIANSKWSNMWSHS